MAVEHLHPPARVSFIVFAPLTGQILRTGTCAQTDLELQAGPGEAVIEGQAEDDRHFVQEGQIVDLPPRPHPDAEFDFAVGLWRAPEARSARAEAAAYLAETDWMVIRAAETGKPVPDDVSTRRAEARKSL